MKKFDINELKTMAQKIREDIVTMINKAGSGHPGGSLSSVELLTYLYFYRMNHDPKNPDKPDRDRFILSKGHCGPAQYAALAEAGYFDREILWTLRDIDSILQGHPDMNKTPGIEMTTGSLGQGISHGVGMALAAKRNKQDYKVYVLLGDGEIQEGQVWEAAMCATHYKLDNLIAIVDDNGLQCDGCTEKIMNVRPIDKRFQAFGFDIAKVDAADFEGIHRVLEGFDYNNFKPKCVVLDSIKGKGVSFMENRAEWHGGALGDRQLQEALDDIRGMGK